MSDGDNVDWEAIRAELVSRYEGTKESQGVVLDMFKAYRRLSEPERQEADRTVAQWVLSGDASKRFDALALIQEFGIASSLPALRQLAAKLEGDSDVSAPYEWAKVNRAIARLTTRQN